VLTGSNVAFGAAGGVGVGAVLAVGSRLGLWVTFGTGVLVGVGVTIGAPDPHPPRSSAVALVNASRSSSPSLLIVLWPFNPHVLARRGRHQRQDPVGNACGNDGRWQTRPVMAIIPSGAVTIKKAAMMIRKKKQSLPSI
jgi:hypothetical protein